MMSKAVRACVVLCLAGCLLVVVGGCKSNGITAAQVRRNMSPELVSMALTHEQHKNQQARTFDTNLRQLVDDFERIWLMDHPLRMSEYPIP